MYFVHEGWSRGEQAVLKIRRSRSGRLDAITNRHRVMIHDSQTVNDRTYSGLLGCLLDGVTAHSGNVATDQGLPLCHIRASTLVCVPPRVNTCLIDVRLDLSGQFPVGKCLFRRFLAYRSLFDSYLVAALLHSTFVFLCLSDTLIAARRSSALLRASLATCAKHHDQYNQQGNDSPSLFHELSPLLGSPLSPPELVRIKDRF